MTDYKQFDVKYHDFKYNDERIRTFSDLNDAMEFVEWIVLCRNRQMKFVSLESKCDHAIGSTEYVNANSLRDAYEEYRPCGINDVY